MNSLGNISILVVVFLIACSPSHREITTEKSLDDQHQAEENSSLFPPLLQYSAANSDSEPLYPSSFYKNVNISAEDGVPLKDVLIELARQSDINMEISPDVKGGITLRERERPFIEIVDKLCDLGGLRYKFSQESLLIELDSPYCVTYPLHFLTNNRITQNRMSISTHIFGSPESGASGLSTNNGSNSSIVAQTTSDFWEELDRNLKTLLYYSKPLDMKDTLPNMAGALGEKDNNGSNNTVPLPSSTQTIDHKIGTDREHSNIQPFTIHKQAGLVSVFGTSKQHALVVSYFEKLRKAVASQVLIEAKIMEVTLNEEHRNGINWLTLAGKMKAASLFGRGANPVLNSSNPVSNVVQASRDSLTLSAQFKDLGIVLDMMEVFGTSKTLSSPRIMVMNNQPAILRVGENRVYFRLKYDTGVTGITAPSSSASATGQNTMTFIPSTPKYPTSEIHTIPIGLILMVQPSINVENGEITMILRPTVTNEAGKIDDPAVTLIAESKNVSSEIPIVSVSEAETMLRMKSGQMVIMGGLMQEKSTSSSSSPTGMSQNFLSNIFGLKEDTHKTVELVIFLRATIIPDNILLPSSDQNFSKNINKGTKRALLH